MIFKLYALLGCVPEVLVGFVLFNIIFKPKPYSFSFSQSMAVFLLSFLLLGLIAHAYFILQS